MGHKVLRGQFWGDTKVWGKYQHLLELTAGVGVPTEHSSGAPGGVSRVYPGVRAVYSLLSHRSQTQTHSGDTVSWTLISKEGEAETGPMNKAFKRRHRGG